MNSDKGVWTKPPMSIIRRIRACESETAAQLVFEHHISDIRQGDAARIAILVENLNDIRKNTEHFIPSYAFSDNEAACDFHYRLACIYSLTEYGLSATYAQLTAYRESERKRIRNEVLEEAADELEKTCAGERWAIFELRAMREE